MTALRARSVRLDDVDQLVVLFDQLGYPQSRDALRGAVETAVADPRAAVLVADDSGTLVGAATYFLVPVVHDSRPWCRITTLVVDEAYRRRGIGQMLADAAEAAARAAGCSRIEATSALRRTNAHRLYEKLGYGRTSAHFLKRL
ncbi:MAG: GNAT family N-acetyltransferase [Solirubrobacteraceae bacterium]|jgi:GNAT superfamily N-acetyltransferase